MFAVSHSVAQPAEWTEIRDLLGPHHGPAAFDTNRGVGVLVEDTTGTTWEWDGFNWAVRSNGGPQGRVLSAAAYDSVRGVTVVFGGRIGSTYLNDTWEWDGAMWTERTTSGPSSRFGHAMAFDAARGVVVLFGGDAHIDPGAETWEWDGETWIRRNVSGPSGRWGHMMAYDYSRNVTVLYGGSRNPSSSGGNALRDTWEWDGAEWIERAITGPQPRQQGAMAFDSARDVCVLHGGTNQAPGPDPDTWEWNGLAWIQRDLPGPGARFAFWSFYDTAREELIVQSGLGFDASLRNRETWSYDGATWTVRRWGAPSTRVRATMAFDTNRSVAVLFGGDAGNNRYGDTWEWDRTAWRRVATTGPSARTHHAMAYDSVRGVTVLLGGSSGTHQTWEWNGAIWALRSTSLTRERTQMVFDEHRGRMVTFGGIPLNSETREWDGTMWQLRSNSGPTARSQHMMAYDFERRVTLLYGGVFSDEHLVWEWNGTDWMARNYVGAGPGPRMLAGMTFDRIRRVAVLFGGYVDNGVPIDETWEVGRRIVDPRTGFRSKRKIRTEHDIRLGCARGYCFWRSRGRPLRRHVAISSHTLYWRLRWRWGHRYSGPCDTHCAFRLSRSKSDRGRHGRGLGRRFHRPCDLAQFLRCTVLVRGAAPARASTAVRWWFLPILRPRRSQCVPRRFLAGSPARQCDGD